MIISSKADEFQVGCVINLSATKPYGETYIYIQLVEYLACNEQVESLNLPASYAPVAQSVEQ